MIVACLGVFAAIATQTDVDVLLAVIYGVCLLGLAVLKRLLGASLSLLNLSIPAFFLQMYILLMAFPAEIYAMTLDPPTRYVFYTATLSVLVTFPLGVLAVNALVPRASERVRTYFQSRLQPSPEDNRLVAAVAVLLFPSIAVIPAFFIYSDHVPLIEVIRQYPTNVDPEFLRFSETRLPDVVQYLYELLRRFSFPFATLYAYFMSRAYGRKWFHIFIALLVATIVINLLTLDRGPVVYVFALVILARVIGLNRSLITSIDSKALLFLFLAIVSGALISVFQYQSAFSVDVLIHNTGYVLTYRVLQDAAFMASQRFAQFDDASRFLYGQSMRPLSLLGVPYIPLAPSGFVADLWTNFGAPGVVFGSLAVGFVFQLFQVLLFGRKSVAVLTIQTIMLASSVVMIYGNVFGVISTSVMLMGGLWAAILGARRRPV